MRGTEGVSVRSLFVASLIVVAAACGTKSKSDTADAPFTDATPQPARCGNHKVEPPEECDEGETTTLSCDATCHLTCGNGAVDTSVGEVCDTGIATGDGACPSSCDDGMGCTIDVLSGSACTAACLHTAITDVHDGDGCCPTGANHNTDSDCSASCGNGIVEAGETCDTGIATGTGSCPTACNDGVACTTDSLMSGGTCQAACMHTPITQPANGDGCCPTGANHNNDNDCSVSCGNGAVETGETCDTAITTGTGKCPTSCSDAMACTKDVLSSAGTCQAACSFPAITMPANGDGCCPNGANANNDNDCTPSCGNKVVESGEQCDDGNNDPNDGCTMCKTTALPPTAFRMTDLDLRDPHTFVALIGCNDITDPNFLGTSVNGLIQTAITTDGDMPADGLLDFSPTVVFRPLDQSKATGAADIYLAACTAPLAGTSCKPGTNPATAITVTNMTGGQCLAALAGTTQPYTPAITNTSAPCFVSNAVTLNIVLAGIPITLHDTKIAATYVGNPAGTLTNGLLMGFITEAEADATVIPANLPVVGGKPLSSLLTGGKTLSDMMNACHNNKSDKDTNNGVAGWWFYLNFPAGKVPWTQP
jgi:cysteine-rich repeat protein